MEVNRHSPLPATLDMSKAASHAEYISERARLCAAYS